MIWNEKELVSIVMPLYREANHIGAVLSEVRLALDSVNVSYEFVLVDDGSPDDTWRVLKEEINNFPTLRAARLSRNFGKESALCAGLEMARGDAVIVMDGDGQHPPALLPEMVRVWRETGVDVVEGIKVTRGEETLFSKISAGLFYLIWNKLTGFDLRGASDYKLMSRRVVNAWLEMEERSMFFRGMTAWVGFNRAQIPFEVAARAGGQSGWSVLKRVRLAFNAITGFSALPLQIITFAGVLFLLFSFIIGLQTLFVFLTGNAVSGFVTVIFLLLLIGSLLMISLGIIGEYLARIYEEVKHRPRYLISQTLESPILIQRSESGLLPQHSFAVNTEVLQGVKRPNAM